MFHVEIRIPKQDQLADEMAAMRRWLDHQHSEPSTFHYIFTPPGIIVRVEFKVEDEAHAFAATFSGRITNPSVAQ